MTMPDPGLKKKNVISASRRTDIPAFYMEWFMEQITLGRFEVINPYNGKTSFVPATPDIIHTIVFWSKNFGPFIKGDYGKRLVDAGYNLFFNFTINSTDPTLEPCVPPLEIRLKQLELLAATFGNRCIQWRLDPICHYRSPQGFRVDNLGDFKHIATKASEYGITRCISSFVDLYAKVLKRAEKTPGLTFLNLDDTGKTSLLLKMNSTLEPLGIRLMLCCEDTLVKSLSANANISAASCIPNNYLMELYGGKLSLARDTGQRIKHGCGCKISQDIGSYRLHPCGHDCLFCYANPTSDLKTNKGKNNDNETS